MWPRSRVARRIVVLGIVSLWGVALSPAAPAQSIDVGLNLFFTDPSNKLSGGVWQLIAKSADSVGINGLDVYLSGVDTPPPQPVGPRGTVNGDDAAGFSEFTVSTNGLPTGVIELVIGQRRIFPELLEPGDEQTIFYGVGTLQNGVPGNVGPPFSSLTDVSAVPWATGDIFGDPDWDTAAILASGVFSPGQPPAFYNAGSAHTTGNLFTTVGDSQTVGTQMIVDSVSTIVRDFGGSPDYNDNGIVDAADYTIWRDTLGQMGPSLAADGNGNGTVDQADYEFWKLNFGLVIPISGGASQGAGSESQLAGLAGQAAGTDRAPMRSIGRRWSGPGAVPEPGSGALLAGMLGILFLRHRFRLFCGVCSPKKSDIQGRNCLTGSNFRNIMSQDASRRSVPIALRHLCRLAEYLSVDGI